MIKEIFLLGYARPNRRKDAAIPQRFQGEIASCSRTATGCSTASGAPNKFAAGVVIVAISIAQQYAPRTGGVNRFIGPARATSIANVAPDFMPLANTLGDNAKCKK